MSRRDLEMMILRYFEANGFTKVKVSAALLSKKAGVTAVDRKGKKRQFRVREVSRWGKKKTVVEEVREDPLGWIDEIEMWDAME